MITIQELSQLAQACLGAEGSPYPIATPEIRAWCEEACTDGFHEVPEFVSAHILATRSLRSRRDALLEGPMGQPTTLEFGVPLWTGEEFYQALYFPWASTLEATLDEADAWLEENPSPGWLKADGEWVQAEAVGQSRMPGTAPPGAR